MKVLFIVLVVAHIIGDFLLQTDGMARAKSSFKCLLFHAFSVTFVTLVLTISERISVVTRQTVMVYPLMLFLVFSLHYLIDWCKQLSDKDGIKGFLWDQAAHIVVLWIIANQFSGIFAKPVICNILNITLLEYVRGLVYLGGFILCVNAGGVMIGKALVPLLTEVKKSGEGPDRSMGGLEKGGKWIGQLERAISYLLIMSGQPGAIGFLFAAKSILRFGEIKESSQRKQAEYIIIGTFMSFGWALLVCLLVQVVL